ncbi:MAG TPA: TetR/AcrR family transcriptional regulator [Bryobacteraceae bacterium]|nr:TetR/AcrR family transcriptional regulator [Bryobacteraceae bacterium]
MKTTEPAVSLRARQMATTRASILDTAMGMLREGADQGFSHEAIAAEAGMSARTVYRHFPDRASLLQGLWERLREETQTRFPRSDEEIPGLIRTAFQQFDRDEPFMRTLLNSEAGSAVRERGGAEGRPAFGQSLAPLLTRKSTKERARIAAVFVALYSAPFWNLLRERGGLSGPEAQEAAVWTMETLLAALRSEGKKGK